MTTINENLRTSDVLLFESGEEINLVRDSITVLSGTVASVLGQVMAQTTMGALTSAVKASGANTGNGVVTIDPSTPLLAFASLGLYTVRCTVAGTNAATFRVTDPKGLVLGDFAYTGSGAVGSFADRIKFTITDGSADFIVGDGFDLTVAAGSGKWAQVAPAAFDGTQYAAAVLLTPFTATLTADLVCAAVVRGPAICKLGGLSYTSGMTGGQQTTALAQLSALGINTRTAYGV